MSWTRAFVYSAAFSGFCYLVMFGARADMIPRAVGAGFVLFHVVGIALSLFIFGAAYGNFHSFGGTSDITIGAVSFFLNVVLYAVIVRAASTWIEKGDPDGDES